MLIGYMTNFLPYLILEMVILLKLLNMQEKKQKNLSMVLIQKNIKIGITNG